jgi:hypothetical protein
MQRQSIITAVIAAALAALAPAGHGAQAPVKGPAGGVIKCWTNRDGVRECGSQVPPEYSAQGHVEISRSGLVVKEQEAAKTPEQLEQERREAARKAEEEKREAQRAAEQATKDRVLLATFATEQDMILAHEGKLATIDSRIRLVQNRQEKLQENLRALRQQAAREERGGKPASQELAQRIGQVEKQIAGNQQFIGDQQREQEALKTRFAEDLERFRKLKSGEIRPGQL